MAEIPSPSTRLPARLPPLSPLGLGAWAFGRTGWGAQDDRDSRAAILRAVELGVNWIDTAAVYGDGHSERLVGSALGQLAQAERPLIFTKGGVRVEPSGERTYRDLSPSSLREECEASLRRLAVERIDLYQLHWPVDDPHVVERAWTTLGELQQEGKIRWAGVSNFEAPLLQRCADIRQIDSVQLQLSLLSRETLQEQLPWAGGHGAWGLVYSPLESGLLSGVFSAQRLRSLPASDWRRRRPRFQEPQLRRTLDLVERLKPVAADLGASLAEMALAWTLAWPEVTAAIVGARNEAQVNGWAGSSKLALDEASLDAIEAALLQSGLGTGPARPRAAERAP